MKKTILEILGKGLSAFLSWLFPGMDVKVTLTTTPTNMTMIGGSIKYAIQGWGVDLEITKTTPAQANIAPPSLESLWEIAKIFLWRFLAIFFTTSILFALLIHQIFCHFH